MRSVRAVLEPTDLVRARFNVLYFEVDERGYYVLRHHTEATLEFCDIRLATCKWFNIQNVIDDPLCEPLDSDAEDGYVYRITIPSLHGVEIELDCKSIRVLSAKPFVK